MKRFCILFTIVIAFCSWIDIAKAHDVTITITGPPGAQSGLFNVNISSNDPDLTILEQDIEVSGPVDKGTYANGTLALVPTASGEVTVDVISDRYTHVHDNPDEVSNNSIITYTTDLRVPPKVTISNVPKVPQPGAFDVSISFTADVTGFDTSDITLFRLRPGDPIFVDDLSGEEDPGATVTLVGGVRSIPPLSRRLMGSRVLCILDWMTMLQWTALMSATANQNYILCG